MLHNPPPTLSSNNSNHSLEIYRRETYDVGDNNLSGSDSDIDTADLPSASYSSDLPAPTSPSNATDPMALPDLIHRRTISTTFVTASGFIKTSYLEHPATTTLRTYVVTHEGDVEMNLHPNYNGPFVVNNYWGQVRFVQPDPNTQADTNGQGRNRSFLLGPISADPGSLFAGKGFNSSALSDSASTISGVATWLNASDPVVPSAQTVQDEKTSVSEALVMGGWGDVTVGFDGGT